MKLHILNQEMTQYGFPEELDIEDSTFNGHQKAVTICTLAINALTNELEPDTNYLPEVEGRDRDADLNSILNNQNIFKIYQRTLIHEDDNANPVLKTIVCIPYYVKDHSCFQPTVNFTGITSMNFEDMQQAERDYVYKIDIEILFSIDDMNRYCTAHFGLIDGATPWRAVDCLFEDTRLLSSIGCICNPHSEDITLDFYNEIGDRTLVGFSNPHDLQQCIMSFRVISIDKVRRRNDDDEC